MAVSPYDLEQKFEHEVDMFESQIDDRLNVCTIHKGGYITISPPTNMDNSHFDILKSRYFSAGWSSVEWVRNERDDDYLKFSY